MSLQTQIHSLVIRVAEEFKTVYSKIGSLSSLSTTDKSTLVAAINELKTAIAAVAVIDDLTPGSTTTTFSASKIVTLLDALRAQILGARTRPTTLCWNFSKPCKTIRLALRHSPPPSTSACASMRRKR